MHRPNIIFFDVGGTLMRPVPSVGQVYHDTAAKRGIVTTSPETVESAFGHAWRELHQQPAQIGDQGAARDWWRRQVGRTFSLLGHDDTPAMDPIFEELFEYFAYSQAWRLFDEVAGALDRLRESDLRLAILSNWDHRLRQILSGFHIFDLFDPIIISFEVGFEKPQKEVYLLACREAGVEPGEALMVGDSPDEDYHGARAAGLQAMLLDRDLSEAADHRISGLDHLSVLLGL